MEGSRKIAVLILLAAAAVPATAQTFGFSFGWSARNVCLSIGAATYRVSDSNSRADYTVRIDPNETAPDIKVHLATAPDEADFVLVDDGETPPACQAGAAAKTVKVSADAPDPDLVVGLVGAGAADYRVYVRSERLSSEAAAALFAVTRGLTGHIAGR